MKATGVFVKNFDERQEADKSGIDIPKVDLEFEDFYFSLYEVRWAHKTTEENILIGFDNWTQVLKYEDQVWRRITKYLEEVDGNAGKQN